MAALTKEAQRRFESGVDPMYNSLIVKSGATIYAGAAVAVEKATGHLYVPVGDTALEDFAGWADETVVGDGVKQCRVRSQAIVELTVAGGSIDDYGKQVFSVDDNTFSTTNTGSDIVVGKVHRFVSGTLCMVYSQAEALV